MTAEERRIGADLKEETDALETPVKGARVDSEGNAREAKKDPLPSPPLAPEITLPSRVNDQG